ncbi:MAG: YggS family pyridoxal phosphate-dependent enzyme [Clostridiales bacterium]|nr:YggS family pyridoxal phosphate-dependent enzyme [Clostridiales bacterium]
MNNIEENLARVRSNIDAAARRSGRNPAEVKLIGVTKTIDVERIRTLLSLGVNSLGENKPQELAEKYAALGNGPEWHLIGHLQTNKVRLIIDKAAMIHSVDSLRLAGEINRRAAAVGRVMDILVELNIAAEPSKHGIPPDKTLSFVEEISELENLRIRGLMCVAPNVDEPEKNRIFFAKMREIFIDIKNKCVHNIDMLDLSMGMTNDYEIAVEEGATIARIGTGIFGSRV